MLRTESVNERSASEQESTDVRRTPGRSRAWLLIAVVLVLVALLAFVPLMKQRQREALSLDLAWAIWNEDVARVNADLALGADPNLRCILTADAAKPHRTMYVYPGTYLENDSHRTDRDAEFAIAKALLEHGANPNRYYNYGRTPLHYALLTDNAEMALLLLQHGADANAGLNLGTAKGTTGTWTPIMFPTALRHIALLKLLLEHGADPKAPFPGGQTILQHDRKWLDPQSIRLLKQYGAPEWLEQPNGIRDAR